MNPESLSLVLYPKSLEINQIVGQSSSAKGIQSLSPQRRVDQDEPGALSLRLEKQMTQVWTFILQIEVKRFIIHFKLILRKYMRNYI